MANFILVSPGSGTGPITIKVKPTSENTSTTVEKKGKLIIRVNGEIQKTIPLTQTVKGSTGGGGGGGTTPKTLTSREISLDIYEGFYPDSSSSKCLTTNADGGTKSNQWYLRPSYAYDTNNSTFKILLGYSVSAIQTDYFSDGTQEYTNLLPLFQWQSDKDDTGTMKNWEYKYNGSPKPVSETDPDVEVQSSDDTPVLAGYTLNVGSKVEMSKLPKISKIFASFIVDSKHRTDITDNLGLSKIKVDIYWTITVLDATNIKNPPLVPNPGN